MRRLLSHLAAIAAVVSTPTLAVAQGALTNGENHTGSIAVPGELDEWTFSANQGDTIIVSIGEAAPDADFYPWIRLFGPGGSQVVTRNSSEVAQFEVTASLTGAYTVRVGSNNSGIYFDGLGDYVLTLAKVPGSFSIATGDQGGPLANGANHDGRIELGDVDMWSFAANQGDALVVAIGERLVPPTVPDPGFYPWIRLFDPLGDLVQTRNGADVAQIGATATLSGTYTVVVGTNNSGIYFQGTGDYRLTLAKVPGSFSISTGDQGGPLANGTSHPGRVDLGDVDIWTFTACQGASISVTLSEVPVPPTEPDPGFYPWLRVFDPLGNLVQTRNGADAAQVSATAALSGTYTAIAGTNNSGIYFDGTGDYTISVLGTCALPTSANDAYATLRDVPLVVPAPGVLANDSPGGAGSMTAELVTPPTAGHVSLAAGGGFTFTPPAGFSGVVTFTYRAISAVGPAAPATVTITVTQPVPTTVADAYSTNVGTPLNVPVPGVLGNDSSNGAGPISAQLVTTVAHGVLLFSADGSFAYTPAAGYTGADSFTYRAVSSAGPGNTTAVTLTVIDTTLPQPPTDLFAKSVVGNTVTLKWKPPASGAAATDYVLEGGVNPGEVAASIPIGSRNPIYTFVAPTGAFHVRIHTVAGGARSAASNEIRIFVNAPAAPSAPANLLGLVNGSSIALAWRNTFAGGAPGGVVLDVSGSLQTTLPLGLTDSFQFLGVPGGTYTLSVRAVNAAGSSPPSNTVTLAFPGPCSGPPLAPSGFLAYATGRTITVVWDPATSGEAPTSYVLAVSGGFSGSFATPGRTLSGTVGAGTYHLSVAAVNACGASTATDTQTVVVP